ncbi:MAG TPA: DUF3341 domain-containing protein [Rhizomicrobium sp.]|jgi:hypothetical protein|nr:DUF3341 domain-containing protein [Rhizomicrobium sp.]
MSGYLLAEFVTARQTVAAARSAFEAKRAPEDVLTPNPIEGITEYLAPRRSRSPIGWVMFAAGVLGAAAGYLMQWYSAVVDYPIDAGGRPLNSWPAFLLVPYETAILSAAVIGILGWMWMCGLPKLFHSLFAAAVTERAVQDRYLLVFPDDVTLAQWVSTNLEPLALHEIRE